MPDPTTIGLGAIAAYLSRDGLQKLLGPTAEYLGEGLQEFTKRRLENIGRIFNNAEKKLGDRINTKGEVPPRVLKEVINEGSFWDDELATEYFGGILASSRTELGRDDRGARLAKILDGLSTYQIRTHYLIYSSIKQLFSKSNLPFNMEGRPKMQVFLPFSGYTPAMDFNESEQQQLSQLLNHIFFGLAAEDLINDSFWQYGPKDNIKKVYAEAQDGGIVCGPSALGAELFLWAFGCADQPLEFIFHGTLLCDVIGLPSVVSGICATKKSEKT
jgi:hypothetical protein